MYSNQGKPQRVPNIGPGNCGPHINSSKVVILATLFPTWTRKMNYLTIIFMTENPEIQYLISYLSEPEPQNLLLCNTFGNPKPYNAVVCTTCNNLLYQQNASNLKTQGVGDMGIAQ